MKKIIVILLLTHLLANHIFSQTSNWFEFNKPYLKITVSEEGIYKVTGTVVNNSGIGILRASQLQMYKRGAQVSIKVNDINGNDVFDNEDYILFYGEKNDGTLDKSLYMEPSQQLNALQNLHADSSAYFITYSQSGPWLRVHKQDLIGTATELKHHTQKINKNFKDFYARGQLMLNNEPVYGSLYGPGVGFVTDPVTKYINSFPINNLYTESNEEIKVYGKLIPIDSPTELSVSYYYGTQTDNANNLIGTVTTSGMNASSTDFSIPNTFTNTSNNIFIRYELNSSQNFRFGLSYLRIEFPQSIVWDPTKVINTFHLKGNIGSHYNFTISNFTNTKNTWNVTSQNDIQEIDYRVQDMNTTFAFNMQSGNDKILISNTEPLEITKLKVVRYSPIQPKNNLFLIVTHEDLQKSSTNYNNPVRAYATYRSSVQGGAYDTMVVNTDYLYDYFTFGEYNPLAIRKLCELMCTDQNTVPKALLLIGKGYGKYNADRGKDYGRYSFVPTWGDPGSDIPFSMGLAGSKKYVQAIPTGRLSVKTPQQVENYLLKIIEHESLPDDTPWKKNVIHLSGGGSNSESENFKNIVTGWKNIITGPYLGASVQIYSKTTDQFIQVFDLGRQLDDGASLVSVLGHSSYYVNDVRIGAVNDPTYNYKNKGKYPIVILSGCESGNIYGFNNFVLEMFAETWINEPDKGSVGFYAHSNLGLVDQFNRFNSALYRNWFNDSLNINKSFGEMIKLTSSQYVTDFMSHNQSEVRHVQQMTFMGDPMVRIFKNLALDFSIESQDVQIIAIDDNPITALSDSFLLKFAIKNKGILPKDKKVNILVKRTLPNGSEVLIDNILTNFTSSVDTFEVYVRLADIGSAGENNISIEIDPNNFLVESNKNNNKVTITRFLPASDMNCLFPREFSIQNRRVLNLVAQSTDLLKGEQEYLIEIDTSFSFNSPVYQAKNITATSLPTWENVNLFEKLSSSSDSIEFFWRIKFTADGTTVPMYANSSFIYITNGRPGWNQSKFHQFDQDPYSANILRDVPTQSFSFVNYTLNIVAKAGPPSGTNFLVDSNQLYINGPKPVYGSSFAPRIDDGWSCCPGLILSAFDSKTFKVYKPIVDVGWMGNWHGAGISNESAISRFLMEGLDLNQRHIVFDNLIKYLETVPDGDYVLLNPIGSINPQNYDPASLEKMDRIAQLIGSSTFQNLQESVYYGVFFRKGYGIVKEQIVPNTGPDTYFRFDLSVDRYVPEGTITSTIIGPASSWGNVYMDFDTDNEADKYGIDVMAIDNNGTETVIFQNVTQNGFDISSIDASIYPKIRLRAYIEDTVAFTPPVIDRWMVTYGDQIPEGTLVVDKDKVTYNTIFKDEGDSLVSEFQFKNISEVAFKDPLVIRYSIKNTAGKQRLEYDTLKRALLPNETIILNHRYNTIGFTGENFIEIFVNPKLQNEIIYTNNLWNSKLSINRDVINPIMDVTFDGRKILNGEIVSPSPFIQIAIKDENKFLLKQDTSGIKMLLKKNCLDCNTYTQVYMQDRNVKFFPATGKDNTFRIEYTPEKLEDGEYTLCVQGADANNNLSGINPYCIEFNVINKSMMTNVYPFPNPFSNYTRFVFTLTGEEIPDEMKIQIMTVSGKVVREIIQSEIGPLKIGTNVTEYAWDGRDEYGDRLANGVYLYKVIARHSGMKYEKMITEGEKAFKNDWGKLVILR